MLVSWLSTIVSALVLICFAVVISYNIPIIVDTTLDVTEIVKEVYDKLRKSLTTRYKDV